MGAAIQSFEPSGSTAIGDAILLSAAPTAARSVVGLWSRRGRWLKASTPTFTRAGTASTKRRAARLAATRRLGFTSVAVIEPDTSVASTIEARSTGTATVRWGRAAARMSTSSARHTASMGAWRRQRGCCGATDGWSAGVANAAAATRRPRSCHA